MKYCLLLSATLLAAGCGGKSTSDWVEQMHSSDSAERLHAAKALGERWGDASAVVPALTEALRDKDSFVRQEAAQSLGKVGAGARPAESALLVALRDRKPAVRKAAAGALKSIDPEAAERAGVR